MASAELVYAERFNPNASIPERWAKLAQAALERVGGDRAIECSVIGNRASAEHHRGEFQAAVDDYRKALALSTAIHGPEHLAVGSYLTNLSDALKDLGNLPEALDTSDQAIGILSRLLGEDHFHVAAARSNRGDLLVAMKRYRDAESEFTAALRVFEKRLPPRDFRFPYALAGLGQVLLETGHAREASLKFDEALKKIDADADQFFRANVQASLGRALCEGGRDCERGRGLVAEALKVYASSSAHTQQAAALGNWMKIAAVGALPHGAAARRRSVLR